MRLLPAIAAVLAAVIAGVGVARGDWGVVVVSIVLGAVAVSALLGRRNARQPASTDEETR